MARPKDSVKLNDEIQKQIVTTIRAGNYIETAAAFAGVSKQSIYNWMRLGRKALQSEKPTKAELVYASFLDAVERALADSEIRDVLTIGKAAEEGDWRAAAWRLERKCMKRWGPNMAIEVSGKDGGPIVHDDLEGMTNEELVERLKILRGDSTKAKEG